MLLNTLLANLNVMVCNAAMTDVVEAVVSAVAEVNVLTDVASVSKRRVPAVIRVMYGGLIRAESLRKSRTIVKMVVRLVYVSCVSQIVKIYNAAMMDVVEAVVSAVAEVNVLTDVASVSKRRVPAVTRAMYGGLIRAESLRK